MFTVNRDAPRRGVILLIVLSLLAMFGLVGIGFLMITSHNKRAAKTLQKVDQQRFSPREDANRAILQVVRGTADADSVIGPHSLLEDLYGNDAVVGQVFNVGDPAVVGVWTTVHTAVWDAMKPRLLAGGQIFEFVVRDYNPQRYVGRAITFTNGPCSGVTSRVVGARQAYGDINNDGTDELVYWVDDAVPDPYGRVPVDPDFPGRPVWKLQVMSKGVLPLGPDGAPGRAGFNDDGDAFTDENDEFFPFPPIVANDDLDLGDPFIINGAPFSGTGFGLPYLASGATIYSPLDPALLDAGYENSADLQHALLPNPTAQWHNRATGVVEDYHTYGPISANEDYDAVDYQNMLMAMVLADDTVPSPSLHRPALINYWFHQMVQDTTNTFIPWLDNAAPVWVDRWRAVLQPWGPDGIPLNGDDFAPNIAMMPYNLKAGVIIQRLKRAFILGPLPEDHPNFDASNPARADLLTATLANLPALVNPGTGDWIGSLAIPWYWEAFGPWDVDNDGDGVPDSIWVDLGLPVRQTPDGRKYKPLFAILCVDQDGRLNINAHGCSEQLRNEYTGNVLDPGSGRLYANMAISPFLPRGQGYGPAEINLAALFLANPIEYRNLLLGDGTRNGRYGETQWMVPPPLFHHLPAPGRSLVGPLPLSVFNDPLSANFLYGYAGSYYASEVNPLFPRTEYGTPADLKGTMTVGLDLRGQPIYDVTQSVDVLVNPAGFVNGWNAFAWGDAGTNDPYEMDVSKSVDGGGLNQPASEDAPFTIGEFERVWRPFDVDTASLPNRLVSLAPLLKPQPNPLDEDRRHKTTPASWDLPCPAAAVPVQLLKDFRDQLFGAPVPPPVADFPSYPDPPFLLPATTAELKHNDLFRWAVSLFPPRSPHDILAARMYVKLRNDGVNDLVTDPSWPQDAYDARAAIERSIPVLMSIDLLAGLKMNVNRPFGNGEDDDLNGVVDEPTERFALAARVPPEYEQMILAGAAGPVPFDHDNDGILVDLDGDGTPEAVEHNVALADPRFDPYCAYRQAYARHLYVLMMALTDDDWYPPGTDTTAPGYVQAEARARGIAQWAVNVVDFRDRDAVMTPFEYDILPFTDEIPDITDPMDPGYNPEHWGTWDVDGIIDPTPPPFPVPLPISPDDAATHRGLVWGCERPELLITETMAVHDRRTEDLPDGGGTLGAGDTDFDQKYQPQGSLFIELFNPQPATDAQPGEFYYDGTWQGGVVLNQGTPAGGHPVWRMVIGVPATPADSTIVDPDDPATGFIIERSMYFFNPSATPILGDGQQFYTAAGIAPILNNRYAVIGPGDPDRPGPASTTKIGFRNPGPPAATNQGRRIVLTPNVDPTVAGQVFIDGEDNAIDDLARPEPVPYLPIVVGRPPRTANAIWPTVAVIIDQPRRLSVSEPIAGYAPVVPADTYDVNIAGYDRTLGLTPPGILPQPQDLFANEYWTDFLDTDDTHAKFRVLHLQRLADPLKDYDSQTNPYRTVDSAQIDLTAFNGVTNVDDSSYITPGTYAFFTRERGETTPPSDNNLWQVTISPDRPTDDHGEGAGSRYVRSVANLHFFGEDFSHTLGYVNEHFGDPRKPDDLDAGTTDDIPDAPGYMGDPTAWTGDTARPFPWLTWNNRPFVSHLELAMVPALSSSRLLVNYSMETGANPYEVGAGSFEHLLNFFQSNDPDPPPVPPLDPPPAHFYRLMEFVHVPSRFMGTQSQLNPGWAVGGPHGHHPPFQWVSRYREPGRINLNTLFNNTPFSMDVYTGLMNDQPGLSGLPMATEFEDSRRNYFATSAFQLSPVSPTRFANPFRSFCGLERVPMGAISTAIGSLGLPGTGFGQGVNATLLRVNPDLIAPRDPLWTYDSPLPAPPLDVPDNSYRNPYFRYQGMQRLGNLTTTRSNVYTVWITMGYFEVERRELLPSEITAGITSVDRKVYQEGYTLGRELGGDTGEVKRHRAFYVIDRSIPVGFLRGRDLNVEKAIVLKRFIE
jgi:hypothetical protein